MSRSTPQKPQDLMPGSDVPGTFPDCLGPTMLFLPCTCCVVCTKVLWQWQWQWPVVWYGLVWYGCRSTLVPRSLWPSLLW